MAARLERVLGKAWDRFFGAEPAEQPVVTPCSQLNEGLLGGLPRGRIVEVFGPSGAGKTAFALGVAAAMQQQGALVAFFDVDHGLSPGLCTRMGVVPERMVLGRLGCGEETFAAVDQLLDRRAVDLVIIDSVAGLVPRAEWRNPAGSAQRGLHAQLMSQGLRRLSARAASSGAVLLFVNQLRNDLHGGNCAEVTTGGQALGFYAATRLRLSHANDHQFRIHVDKARFGRPDAKGPFLMSF
jgi:recombination protein RecA